MFELPSPGSGEAVDKGNEQGQPSWIVGAQRPATIRPSPVLAYYLPVVLLTAIAFVWCGYCFVGPMIEVDMLAGKREIPAGALPGPWEQNAKTGFEYRRCYLDEPFHRFTFIEPCAPATFARSYRATSGGCRLSWPPRPACCSMARRGRNG